MDSTLTDLSLHEEAFDLLPMAALVVDRDGRVLISNAAMNARLREHAGQTNCLERPLDSLFARDAEYLMTDLRTAASGGRLIMWLRGGSQRLSGRMCFQVIAIPGTHRRVEHFLLVEDKTKSMSRMFSELNVRLRRANEQTAETHRKHRQLKENYETLEQFSLVAAHDLKAPLLNISLLLEFLQEEYGAILDGPAQDLVLAAKESATRLQNLISSLLNHARSGAADLKLQTFDVAQAVDKVRQSLAAELRDADGEIRVIGDLGTVRADPDLFGQLLQNTISNAIKYRHPSRSPVIRIERVRQGGRPSKLVISDNGRGFDPTEKDRMFEPFNRLAPNKQVDGSGVGLAICKTVCKRHGWCIEANGVPDIGASFSIIGIDKTAE